MILLHRLARSAARLNSPAVALVVMTAACSQGERVDFLAPAPNPPSPNAAQPTIHQVRIEPRIATSQVGWEFRFTAVGLSESGQNVSTAFDWHAESGMISQDGRFVGSEPGAFRVIVQAHDQPGKADTALVTVWRFGTDPTGVLVQPQTITLESGDTLSFIASLTLANGTVASGAVNWTASGGLIDHAGYYVAPQTPGVYTISAGTETGLRGTAIVQVVQRSAHFDRVKVTPKSIRLAPGESYQFSASDVYSDSKSLPGTYVWTATGGTITARGEYTAGTEEGEYKVVATAAGSTTLADTASVTVVRQGPVLQSIRVTPDPVTVLAGGAQQFTVSGTLSDGSSTRPVVSWSSTGGSVSGNGLYNAGSLGGTYRVVATERNGSIADTAFVTIQPPQVIALGVVPKVATVPTGSSLQLTPSATWSNGSRVLPPLTWSATGGAVSSSGVYTAGSSLGTYLIVVSGGGLADTARVNVTPSSTLASLAVNPKTAQLTVGGSLQFAANATWSDGSVATPVLTWSATGGTISPAGLYYAGSNPGTFRVVVSDGNKADTASIVVSAPAAPPPPQSPTVTSFTVSPESVSLAPGASQQFQSSVSWSDGQTRPVSVTYSATGGSISMGGLFAAGQLAGTFAVIASCSCGRADTAAVFVMAPTGPTLSTLTLSPASVSLSPGGTQAFAATARWSDGGSALPTLIWSATGGVITSQGVFTAGSNGGTYQVLVQSATVPSLRDSATVVISGNSNIPPAPVAAPQAIVSEVSVSLVVPAVPQADRYRWRGGANSGATSWGPVDIPIPQQVIPLPAPGSHWTCVEAGNSAGYSDTRCNSYMVSSVTSGTPSPTLVAIELTPAYAVLSPGSWVNYTTVGRMSDNSTSWVSVSFPTVEGGVLSGNTYTAGSVAGTYRVIAKQTGGNLADTAIVVINAPQAPPPPPPPPPPPQQPPPPPPPANPGGIWPNEPAGYQTLIESDWESAPIEQWTSGDRYGWRAAFYDGSRSGGFETITDSRLGESRALAFTYPAYHMGGGGLEYATVEIFNHSKVYFANYVKWSGNFFGHPSGVFKDLLLQDNSPQGSNLWATFHSIGAGGSFSGRVISQIPNTAMPNAFGGSLSRGDWHLVEMLVDMSGPTRWARLFVNGSQVAQITWTGGSNGMQRAWLSGMMGGIGATGNPSEQKFWVDRVKVSWGN
jgi:hypothetical protein